MKLNTRSVFININFYRLIKENNVSFVICSYSSLSSHSGRRKFITNLANKGISVRLLASLAGHRNISTTQCYIDVNDDMKCKAVELFS